MLFNSWQFILFFIIVYALYLKLNHERQNWLLLVASCIFYGAWSWKFLVLMFVSISSDYFCGIKIDEAQTKREKKFFLFLSLGINLIILGFFKYCNFFITSFADFLNLLGFSSNLSVLNVILPVGISFYTFQAMSYSIDIYRGELKPVRNYRDYALFVSYFPQLVAGPIMRAKDLLPQVLKERMVTVEKISYGSYLMVWGYFQKVFIADNLAKIVDPIFAGSAPYNGPQVLLGVYAFAFQIYCDFAGYSNIARGLGQWMGFDIMVNFNKPYFSTNPREFWQRWHISLSQWLRDYLYIPLGGNKHGTRQTYRNLAITMVVGGFWHGAAWTFVIWGAYHGVLLIVHRMISTFWKGHVFSEMIVVGKIWNFIKVVCFFHLVCLGWLFFRATSIEQIINMLKGLIFNFHVIDQVSWLTALNLLFFISLLLCVESIQSCKRNDEIIFNAKKGWRYGFYYTCLLLIMFFGVLGKNQFIYFQF